MLIAQNFVVLMHKLFGLYTLVSTSLYKKAGSYPETTRGYLSLSSSSIQKFPFLIALSVLFIVALTGQFVYALSGDDDLPTDSLVPSIQYILSTFFHIPTLIEHYRKREDVCSLFNSFIDFELKHNGNNWVPSEALRGVGGRIKNFLNIVMGTGPLYAIFYWQHMVTTPCFPGNLGYFLLPECRSQGDNSTLNASFFVALKFILATFSAWLYLFTFATVVEEFAITIMQPYCIMNYLRLFLHKMRLMELNIAYRNTKEIKKLLELYREIELLTLRYNGIHAGYLSLTSVADVSSAFIVSLYTIVGLNGDAPIPLLCLCSGLVFDIILVIFELDGNIKSGVFLLSKRVRRMVLSSDKMSKDKASRRHIRSWRVLRIYLGSSNFYDVSTPLTLINFSISTTVNLLLM